jgi:carboxyl-terminal processing protease
LGAIFAGILMCCSAVSTFAAPIEAASGLDFDEDTEQHYVEIPVDSIQQFVQIYGIVKDNYVDVKPDEVLFQQAIKGLVGGLDRYSRYLSAEDYKQLMQYTEGDLASVDFALVFEQHTKQWQIRDLKEGSDSYKLGLRNGQKVIKIDDQIIQNLNHEQVHALLYGSIGSTLQIQTSLMNTPQTLVRNKKMEADIQPVLLHNQVLVLKVKVFQQDTANEIKRLLEEYDISKLKAVLIDLRNNPGGLLSAAVETADLFLNQELLFRPKVVRKAINNFRRYPAANFKK